MIGTILGRRPDASSILATLALLLFGSNALAQSASDWVREADRHYEAGRFAESADAYDASITAGAVNPTTFYNAACSAALAGRVDAAFVLLDDAVGRGFRNCTLLAEDDDLAALHEDPRWEQIRARCAQAEADFLASLGIPELRAELLEMRRIDQAMRRGESLPELEGRGMSDVDSVNTVRMREIIAEHGWPTKSLVGEDGARSAWLLVQHADAHPGFQRECLELMNAVGDGEVDAVDLAYLTDRVLVNEGMKQIYGTQFWKVEGVLVPRPIEDEAAVEALRADVGMGTMQDYHQRMTGRDWVVKERD
jgi:hypothetical protein